MATKWRRNGKVRADDMEIENRYTDTVQNQVAAVGFPKVLDYHSLIHVASS